MPALAQDARLPTAPLREEALQLPGDPLRPVTLETTLFLPPGPGPFPLAVMNHGATNISSSNRGERYRFTAAAYYFLSRGYAVALPMMRGFSRSGGVLTRAGCDLASVARLNGRDLRGAIERLVATRREIDGTRIVVAGQSFGGWNTLGLGTAPPAGTRALVVINGVIRSSDCKDQDPALIAAAGQLGREAKVPALLFYGDNDSLISVPTWRGIVDSYKRAGGSAELVAFGRYGEDSHQMLSDPASIAFWGAKADAFLARAGLPAAPVHPAYLPHAVPAPSHFAALSDASAVPYLSAEGRAAYARFLSFAKPRAFAIAPDGAASAQAGGYDPAGRAMRECAARNVGCALYAFNDQVVWTAPKPGDIAVRVVDRTVRRDTATPLGAFYALKPDCSSRGLPRVLVTQQPAHGIATVEAREELARYPPASPFAACNGRSVAAMGLAYTPSPGFSGTDTLTIDYTPLGGTRQLIKLELTVM